MKFRLSVREKHGSNHPECPSPDNEPNLGGEFPIKELAFLHPMTVMPPGIH